MRILNVTAQKPDSTGSGVYLSELVRCQLSAGHRVAVVCGISLSDQVELACGTQVFPVHFETDELPFPVCGMSDEMPYPATRYCDLTPDMVRMFEATFAAKLERAVRDFRPDVVVCHHLYLLTAIVRERLSWLPVGAVCHSTDLRQMEKHDLASERICVAVRQLDAVFALHDEQKREIVHRYGVDAERVHVVGTGYNSHIFYQEDSDVGCGCDRWSDCAALPLRLDAAGEQIRPVELIYAGKIWGKKGVPSLIAALDAVDACGREVVLRLAGGYNDLVEYERIRQQARECRSTVEFLGRLSQADLARAYRRAEVFVLPSFFEGLPLVVIEALACGCKVVMTDLPGIRPWLESHAPDAVVIYVEPPRMRCVDDPYPEDLPAFERRLAQALSRAIVMPSAPSDVRHLSWESVSDQVLRIMEKARFTIRCD